MESQEFESCICQFEPSDNDSSIQRFHLRDCPKYCQLNKEPEKAGQYKKKKKTENGSKDKRKKTD
jgi:hypothetical protein